MTSRGGSSPVHRRKAWAAWGMSMPRPLAGRIEPLVGPEGVEGPGPVGVVAEKLTAPFPHHGVDGTQGLGRGCEAVEGAHDVGLVGHRHRQSGEPDVARPLGRRRRPPGRHLEGGEDPVELEGPKGGVVDDGRHRVPDGMADHGRHPRRPRKLPGWYQTNPLARAWRTSSWNLASVAAKAWRPLASART